ncbi:MAG: hypothetical protein J6D27_02845 [Ruminiclostridium sp.]|nr:hypothetical protein [Ruminiclostridium sp.]
MSKLGKQIRNLVLVAMVIALSFACTLELLQIQIVDGEYYLSQTTGVYGINQTVQAARGQIMTSDGVVLNSNKLVYKVIVQKAFFESGTENDIICKTLKILVDKNEKWTDTLPITKTTPYKFTGDEYEIDALREELELGVYATAENCMNALYEKYKISDVYGQEMRRNIAGVRYEMQIRDFSYVNRYVMAEDVKLQTVIELKEQSFMLKGIDIVEEPTRTYLGGEFVPHVLGRIGAISAEEYEELADEGYALNDVTGKWGIESAMESVLRGKNGVRTISKDSDGNVISDLITTKAQEGNSIKLTIDYDFQNDVQAILDNHINWLHYNNDPTRGNKVDAGGVVVLDAKTGGVLAMANYPNYNINDYIKLINNPPEDTPNPTYNRCIYGLYRPGSTFKTITATAALTSGIADEHTNVYCGGIYTYYSDYQPGCIMGFVGDISVRNALRYSCNIYFYDMGRQMGIEYLAQVAGWFGVGQDLNLEIGGFSGSMSTPEYIEELGGDWTPGSTIQASIGQLETTVTPLTLATIALTFANDGVRYQPYLVDSITNYDGTEVVEKTKPVIANKIDADPHIFEVIREGMIMVADDVQWPMGSGRTQLADLPYGVAIKTGTPQVTEDTFNSTILGYYPAEDPQICFGIVLEKGEFTRLMIRNIIESYFYDNYKPVINEKGEVTLPWGGKETNTPGRPERDFFKKENNT